MTTQHSAQLQNELFSLDPEWDKGFDMDLPGTKTPFPDTDGKRGFVFEESSRHCKPSETNFLLPVGKQKMPYRPLNMKKSSNRKNFSEFVTGDDKQGGHNAISNRTAVFQPVVFPMTF